MGLDCGLRVMHFIEEEVRGNAGEGIAAIPWLTESATRSMRDKLGAITQGLNNEANKWKGDEDRKEREQATLAKKLAEEAERWHKAGKMTKEMLDEAKKVVEQVLHEHSHNEPLPLPTDFMQALEKLQLSKEQAREFARKERERVRADEKRKEEGGGEEEGGG